MISSSPPPGYQPGQTRGPLITGIALPVATIALSLACLRFYVRVWLVRAFGKDDCILLAAVVFLCGLVGSSVWGVCLGFGRHQYDLAREGQQKLRSMLIPGVLVPICYNLCEGCVQCSILAFYLRIGLAETGGYRVRRLIYTLMCFSIITNTAAPCLITVFTVIPSFLMQHKYITGLWYTYGTLNLLMDLTIWSIPLPTVFSVMQNVSTRKKVLLVLVFAIGSITCVSSILRISFGKYATGLKGDPTYTSPIFIVLYTSEVSIAISCASLATLRPLVVQVTKKFNRLRGKPTSTNKSRSTGYEFGQRPTNPQSKGFGSTIGGTRTTGNKGGFMTVDQELMEWKDNFSEIERSQSCSCPRRGGDIEPGNMAASSCPRCHDPARRLQPLVPTPATTDNRNIHRSSRSSSGDTLRTTNIGSTCQDAHSRPPCDALPSSESTVNLTDGNANSATGYPRPLV